MDEGLRFELLGGLSAWRQGRRGEAVPLDLGGPRPRRLLAALLLSLDRPIPPDRLIELVWGDEPPESARGSLQACVSKLRREFEPDRPAGRTSRLLVLVPGGYQLLVAHAQLDLGTLERSVAEGIGLVEDGSATAAIDVLARALAGWAPLLPELADVAFVRAEADRLDARRRAAFEVLQTARVAAGAHHDAVADLRRAVAHDPRAERCWGLLALALYRSGHPAEAIAAIADARRALRNATGLELGPELRSLEADLFAQAPSLAASPAPDRAVPATAPTRSAAPRRAAPSAGVVSLGSTPRSCCHRAGRHRPARARREHHER